MKVIMGLLVLAASVSAGALPRRRIPRRRSPSSCRLPLGIDGHTQHTVAQRLSQKWGQTVVVENRGGGGHSVGAGAVAKAAPDGYTLMGVEAGTFVASPFLYRSLPFDADKDFAPIAGLASSTMAWVVHPSVPARNMRELVELAKSKPKTSLTELRVSAVRCTIACCCWRAWRVTLSPSSLPRSIPPTMTWSEDTSGDFV
jgi:hypothetical protein